MQTLPPPTKTKTDKPKTDKPNVRFRRGTEYTRTYRERVLRNPTVQRKFRDFMELKRNSPFSSFGSSDKSFVNDGFYNKEIPGIRHAHITYNLSISYKVVQEGDLISIYLYGLHTHDELGTGQPPNINKQRNMATRFKNEVFTEDSPASITWAEFLSQILAD